MADETAQGVNTFSALTDQERKSAAYNALSKSYGPAVAYDPQAANAAAQASAQIPLAPATATAGLATSQAEAPLRQAQTAQANVTAKTGQIGLDTTAALRGAKMLQAIAAPDGSIDADSARHLLSNPAFQIQPDHIEPLVQRLSQPGGSAVVDNIAQAMQAGGKLAGGVQVVTNSDGSTSIVRETTTGGVQTTNLGNVKTAGQQNASTNVVNANTKKGMLGVAEENAGTNRYRANTTANNSLFGNPGDPLPGDNRPSANGGGGNVLPAPSVDRIGAGNPPGTITDPQALFNRLPPKGKSQAISQATQIVNQGTNLGTTNQILSTVLKQISPYTAGSGSLLKDLPGSAQTDLKANLATLKAQGLMSWISSIKNAGGQTGIGRVLQSEANAATNLYGNMEQDQSAKQLAFHAGLFQQTVNKLYQHSGQAFKAMYGVQPHEAIGTDEPNTAGVPVLPGGWKYIGVKK